MTEINGIQAPHFQAIQLNGGSKIAEVQMTAQKLLKNLEATTPISTSKPSARRK